MITKLPVIDSNDFVAIIDMLNGEDAPKQKGIDTREVSMPYLKEGTIRKRKDGRWEYRFMWNGKQKSVCKKTQADCLQRAKELLALRNKGMTSQHRDKPYYLFSWLEHFLPTKKSKISQSWYTKLTICLNTHIKKQFDNILLSKLKPMNIESGLEKISSTRMREDCRSLLNMALNNAYKNDLLPRDIMRHVDKHKHTRVKGLAFTTEQLNQIFSLTKDTIYHSQYLFYLYTGCRPEEIYKIKSADINLEKMTIFIDGTKTKTSKRLVPILTPLFELCCELKGRADTLFTTSFKAVEKSFRGVLDTLQLKSPEYSLKSFRHSYATLLFESNINTKTISVWLGHSSINTTNKTYIDLFEEHSNVEAEKLNSIYTPNLPLNMPLNITGK